VPMLAAGDEMGRTQLGNNNAYCHDSELSWVDWQPDGDARRLLEFARRVIALRKAHPVLRRRVYSRNISWRNSRGGEMSEEDWKQSFARCLGVFMSGRELAERDERGRPVEDDDLLLLVNAHHDEIAFVLPGGEEARWDAIVDSSLADGIPVVRAFPAGAAYPLQGRSLVLLAKASTSSRPRTDG